jgi:methyl-accepting chemotaxis protein
LTTIATEIATSAVPASAEYLARRLRLRMGRDEPALLLAFASTRQPLDEIVKPLSASFPNATILGASTAGEFIEDRCAKGAAAVFALAGDYRVHAGIGAHLKADPERAVAGALAGIPRDVRGYPFKTALMLLDPTSGDGEEPTRIAASMLGPEVRVVGGAAGDNHDMNQARVACGAQSKGDAVAIGLIFSKLPLGIGVSHGHTPISRPLRVTRAEGNVVMEIEGRPAWSVWVDQARIAALDHDIDVDSMSPEQELAFLLRFEAALTSGGGYAIRAPLARRRDGGIAFAGGIESGTSLRITESSAQDQVRGAREAARRAGAELGGRRAAGAVVFDCVCRDMLLRGAFMRAVRGISEELGDAPLAGFESYGEIARSAGDDRGFHNATSVVLAFPAA